MTGGMAEWLDAGLPVSMGVAPDTQDLRPPGAPAFRFSA
jgi:hypothetical protein